ncbi:MAG: precorrin-8X methylmutase [Treponema sp.]|nr:precorrin-8X methylmutase [Treponema sp.]
MATIEAELKERQVVVPERLRPVVFRAIHASADFEYAETLTFSQSALDVACNLLAKASPRIVTDTNMALAGISRPACRKLGIEACCFMADEDVAKSSAESALTRAACSVDKTARLFKADGRPVVYVCGNAPTALVRIRQLSDAGIFSPAFVIGVPVGFVNVTAAKELILNSSIPHIVARGRKGGSTIAAAIMNALLYEFTGRGRS